MSVRRLRFATVFLSAVSVNTGRSVLTDQSGGVNRDLIPDQPMSSFFRRSILHPLRLVCALAACSSDPISPNVEALTLGAAQARWKSAGLASYRFVSHASCECLIQYAGPLLVTVRQGRVTEVVDVATGAARPVAYRQPVDSIFALIRTEIAERPEQLQVTYDHSLGFPRMLVYGNRERDGGGDITMDNVQVIP